MAFGGCCHILGAVVNDFYGASGFHGQQRGVASDDGRIIFLAAERATRFHLHDTNLVLF